METIKHCEIHVIPSFACNLNCSHCDVKHKTKQYQFNEVEFFKSFDRLDKDNSIVLFGGEPLLNSFELLSRIISSGKITSMTTNFLLLEQKHIDLVKHHKVILGTSWNPDRFTPEQYEIWKNKIKLAKDSGLYVEVFITLTDNLFEHIPQLLDVLDDIDQLHVNTLTLSMVIPTNAKLVDKADNLFCWLEDNWRWHFLNRIKESMLAREPRCTTCINRALTLYPNGFLDYNCTHVDSALHSEPFDSCKTCPFLGLCGRCLRQPVCVFYRRYFVKLATMCMNYAHKKFAGN